MQPQVDTRSVTARGVEQVGAFGMRAENAAHIFNILRSTLYSNKVLAVLREYSANAWDEHRAAGIPDRPIKVVLPTALEPTLRIRDYGRGLSEQQVFDVYTQYGSSTKRDDDLTVGALGIGSKSAFAYADSFTVTSWHGGQKSVYFAVLDESNVGTMSLMWRGPCDPSETGIEVSLAVDVADCARFNREAVGLYPYFTPRPEINSTIPTPRPERSAHGDVDPYTNNWVAVMGCIPYAIDMNTLREDMTREGLSMLSNCGGVLRFDIGEVSISASREGLEYTPRTRAAIVRRLKALIADVRASVERIVDDPTVSDWERRLTVIAATRSVGMIVRSKWDTYDVNIHKYASSVVGQEPFTMRRVHRFATKPPEPTWSVDVIATARIIVRDTHHSHRGYPITHDDRIVYPTVDVDAAETALNQVLSSAGLGGIPVVRMTTLPYTPSARRKSSGGTATPPRKERCFALRNNAINDYRMVAPSQNWEAISHTPSPDDVFFVLNGFRPGGVDEYSFPRTLRNDRLALAWLGGTYPRVIGYRTSARKPFDPSKVPGRPYDQWWMESLRDLMARNPDKAELVRRVSWTTAHVVSAYRWRSEARKTAEALTEHLGAEHPVTTYIRAIVDAVDYQSTLGPTVRDTATHIAAALDINEPVVAHRNLVDRYPLLNQDVGTHGIDVLLVPSRRPAWLEYIRLIDASGGANPDTVGVSTDTDKENP